MHPISFKFMQLLSLNVEYYFAPGSSTSCVDVVCINASLCINAAGAPCIYFTFMKRTSLSIASTSVFLSLQYGNLIDFASVYKRIMKPRNDWFQQLKYEMERATAMTYSGNGGGGQGSSAVRTRSSLSRVLQGKALHKVGGETRWEQIIWR